jgi:hypothetical protein
MKTTWEIDDGVMLALKREAALQGKTMSELVEAAIRQYLRAIAKPQKPLRPLPKHDFGGELVDIADRDALYRAMEEEG